MDRSAPGARSDRTFELPALRILPSAVPHFCATSSTDKPLPTALVRKLIRTRIAEKKE
jgi:hypothetical protein